MSEEPADLKIGEVARRAGAATSAIRYYERVGLLPAPERVSGQRRYGDDVLGRLAFISVAQNAGFTLDEPVARVAGHLHEAGELPWPQWYAPRIVERFIEPAAMGDSRHHRDRRRRHAKSPKGVLRLGVWLD